MSNSIKMVTPVVLTFNEANNIHATLASLKWARRVVVLDSHSSDQTAAIAQTFSNVDWYVRKFDNHRAQWEYAVHQTSITAEYILALDADMRPSIRFVDELDAFLNNVRFDGAVIPFEYRIMGSALMGSIYPAQVRLFRRDKVRIVQPGHSQNFEVSGEVYMFRAPLIHEDLKPIGRWLNNQIDYAVLEASRITSASRPAVKDRIRLAGLGPAIVGALAYIRAGGPFRPVASRAYACERVIFEAILSRVLADRAVGMSNIAFKESGEVIDEVYDSRK